MTLNRPIFFNTLRSQRDAPVRLVIAGLLIMALYSLVGGEVSVNSTPLSGMNSLVMGGNYALTLLLWLLGLGLISRDISSGSIQLVLLRPLTRASYVLSKWAALSSIGIAVLVFMYAAYLSRHGLDNGSGFGMGLLFTAQCLQIAAVVAVITLFSSVPINFGELGLLVLCVLSFWILKLANLRYELPFLNDLIDYAWRVLLPSVAVSADVAEGSPGDLVAGLIFNATVAIIALAGAIGLMRRREFSYAESGG